MLLLKASISKSTMSHPDAAIIIPAYNEAQTIAKIVEQAKIYGHVIVVNDGSADLTAEMASKSGAQVISHPVNRGYDAALCSGYKAAVRGGFLFVVTLDADGQHLPELIQSFIDALRDQDADIVIGQRDQITRFSEHVFNLYTKHRYGIDDILCGLKGFRSDVLKENLYSAEWKSAGTALVLAAARQGKRVIQIPITVKARQGRARIGGTLRANFFILKALFADFVS